jgi:hypothetical protein
MGKFERTSQGSEPSAHKIGGSIWIVLVFALFSVPIAHNSLVALRLTLLF